MKEKKVHESAARLLRAARELRGIDGRSELARLLGVSPQMLTNWMRRGVSQEGMLDAERLIGVRATWLKTGDGEMLDLGAKHTSAGSRRKINAPNRGESKKSTEEQGDTLGGEELPRPTEDEFAFVPQLDIAAACGNGRFEDHVVVKGGLAFKKSFLRERGIPEHSARVIYAEGNSMAPTIQDGRVVLLNLAQREPIDTKIFAICLPDGDGGLVLKRLVRDYHPVAGQIVWILRSDNPDKTLFPDRILPPDDRTMIIGRAAWTDNLL